MNAIGMLDLLSLLATLVALVILGRGWKRPFRRDAKWLLVAIVILNLFHSLSNVLEWFEISRTFDAFEDYIEVLVPVLWGSFFYAFLRDSVERDLRETESRLTRTNRELLVLQSASAAITSSLDLQHVLNTVTHEMVTLLGVESCYFSDWDQARDTVAEIAAYAPVGWRGDEPEPELYHLADYPMTKRVLVEQKAIQMTIGQPDLDPSELAYMKKAKLKTLLMLPMVYQDRTIGLVDIEDGQIERTFTEHEISLAQALANQASSTVHNARLYEQARQEIAERQRAEEALRESEVRYRTLVEDMPVLVCRFLKDGTLTFANGHYCQYFGRGCADLVGHSFFQFLEQDQRQEIREHHASLTPEDPTITYEHQVPAPGGELRWLRWTDRALFDEQGHPVEYQAMGEDVTERKEAEAEREALIAELEAKNTELERFTYTVSHDLKSPLITIQGFLGFLEQDAIAGNFDQMKTDITRISNAVQTMQQLLDELLELSRIGRIITPPEDVHFGELAREALDSVAGRLAERDIEVEIAPELLQPDGPRIHGDRARLREVIENLVDNAVKFIGEQPEPRVQIGMRLDAGETAFFVRDNGVGIEPRYQEKIFDLFEKLDARTEGSGIGLAIVQRIVEVHGGRIWVESEGLKRGTTFLFTLPSN